MPTCLGGGGRSFRLHLEVVKSPSQSPSSFSSQSSILTERRTSPARISNKRPRAPRKRPNQRYNEAAVLLSTANPKLFSTNELPMLYKHTTSFSSFYDSLELLPPTRDTIFLTNQPEKPSFRIEPKSLNSPSIDFWEPGSPGLLNDGFDVESILDGEIEEGIDSIMGSLNMSNHEHSINSNTQHLMGLALSGEVESRALRRTGDIRDGEQWSSPRVVESRALRHTGDGEQWSSRSVAVREIFPKFKTLSVITLSEKKKCKKKKKEVEKEVMLTTSAATTTTSIEKIRSSFKLKLNYEEVFKEWSDRGSLFSDVSGGATRGSSAEILARLEEIVPSPKTKESGGGAREDSVMRYKEKRRSRLFLNKIRYQVRKVNADRQPRMKGRFTKRQSSVEEATEKVSK